MNTKSLELVGHRAFLIRFSERLLTVENPECPFERRKVSMEVFLEMTKAILELSEFDPMNDSEPLEKDWGSEKFPERGMAETDDSMLAGETPWELKSFYRPDMDDTECDTSVCSHK